MVRLSPLRLSLCLLALWTSANAAQAQKPTIERPAVAPQAANRPGVPKTGAAAQPAAPSASVADPALDKVLDEWFKSSKLIKKLEGEHRRFVYDFTFGVVKKAEGEFYYEAPDKGRIDIVGIKVTPGAVTNKANPITRQPTAFSEQSDMPQRWICDGAKVVQIDDAQKTVETYPIPESSRGQQIMDGPLPFLFGMPPEKAKQRYQMRLVDTTPTKYIIQVLPRLPQDSSNYKWAVVILERKTMLPEAVQMIDPAETTETVYTFPKVVKNPTEPLYRRLIGANTDPFKPNLNGYKAVETDPVDLQKKTAGAKPAPGPAAAPLLVPSVYGLSHEKAKEVLERSGLKVKFFKGDPADDPDQTFHVYKQSPAAKSAFAKGDVVNVMCYAEPVAVVAGNKNNSTSPKAAAQTEGVPNVRGLKFREAETVLKEAGYTVKLVRGKVATRAELVHTVQEQLPRSGSAIEQGETVTLTLFIAAPKPEDE